MDKQIETILRQLEDSEIGLDGNFKFHCTQCGKCCKHRDDIILNPRDIYNMSKELGIDPEKLLQQFCESYIGENSRMPVVRLKPRGSVQRCPMLKYGKCMVHNAKPVVCAMFPIGRYMLSDIISGTDGDRIRYIYTDPDCGDDSETHTVRNWLESFGIPTDDKFFVIWQKVTMELVLILTKMEGSMGKEVMEIVWTAVLTGMYLNYKTAADFMPQFEKNVEDIFAILQNGETEEGGNRNGSENDTV